MLGVYDVYRGSPDAAIANVVQVPVNDPLLLIPAMAYVTHNLGFGVTMMTVSGCLRQIRRESVPPFGGKRATSYSLLVKISTADYVLAVDSRGSCAFPSSR